MFFFYPILLHVVIIIITLISFLNRWDTCVVVLPRKHSRIAMSSSSREALRWGILGAGKIAHDFIIALKTLPAEEHHVVAIGASSCDRAQSLCSQHGVTKAYGSYKEVVSDPEVQVAYVSTIHPSHKELCLLALEHGKHVLCEKPLTMNLKDAKQVLQTAREKNLFIMEVS